MRVLLLHPGFPDTFWSFRPVLELVGKKALIPPLGLITLAALLPQRWDLRLVDCAVRPPRQADWEGVDLVMITGMIVQHDAMLDLLAQARRRGLPCVVGGPYATSVPQVFEEAGVDYLVLDEAEISLAPFLEHLQANGPRLREPGAPAQRFTAQGRKPELTETPVPRFDLLQMHAYDAMSIQYSRGCPFLCEFCDIITLYGRRPRTKTNAQVMAELDALYALGWRGGIFLVDDNFIGNKPNVKKLLPELRVWQARHGTPFWFDTEASIDLAADRELVAMMVACNFASVFIGIETPDADSLLLTKKQQNTRAPMEESIDFLTRAGLRVMCGMIVGFDNEKPGAGERIAAFCERASVATVLVSLLQVLPNTGLWTRLEREGRLINGGLAGTTGDNDGINFHPTRPATEIAEDFLQAHARLYDPEVYLDRVYRQFLHLGTEPVPLDAPTPHADLARRRKLPELAQEGLHTLRMLRALLIVVWRQGMMRRTRRRFWSNLAGILRHNRARVLPYLAICAHAEHFLPYEKISRAKIEQARPRLAALSVAEPAPAMQELRVTAH